MTESTQAPTSCPWCGAPNMPGSRFCSACGRALADAAPAVESRKTVTILFCDATSSTALGERLDPESLRGLMSRYFDVMRELIEYHGGVVEKFIGDAVMAVFGVPAVHEDDALRACRAAVEIRERLSAMDEQLRVERGATIEWRMGLNTGEVVAGDAVGGQRLVTGDPVNVAARLEAAASPGETLLGPETFNLVRSSIEAEAIEPLQLKGKADSIPAWRLLSVSSEARRRARPLEAPLIGRRRPLRLLDEAFREAVEERVCHLFTVLGVAGVGKSRLVDEFAASLRDEATIASGRCLAYGHGITFWPVAQALRQALDLTEGDSADAVMDGIRSILDTEPEAERIAAVIRGVLAADATPASQDEIFWAFRKAFEAMARNRPLILVFDDIHWGEPTFLDLVEHIAEWTRDAPILLIAMARAELLEQRPAWGGGKRWVTTISLEPLSGTESDELVDTLLGRAELPDQLREQISNAAEGNPLFLEEVLAKLIDDGFLVAGARGWSMSGDARSLTIPASIQALLAARLDGLGSEDRAVIERAAVEGKVFHRGAVTELAPEALRGQVRDRLASLMRMELVRPDTASFIGDEAYRFRHLLIRDAAYQALAKQTRSELHERFGDWLERVAGDRRIEFQEIIGYHLEQAYRYRSELGPADEATQRLAERAGSLLADAGLRARRRGDVAATVDLIGRAVELLPPPVVRERALVPELGFALFVAGKNLRAESVLAAAVAEAEAVGDGRASALAMIRLLAVRASTQSIGLMEMASQLERLEGVLREAGDRGGALLARSGRAFVVFGAGHAADALRIVTPVVQEGSTDESWYRDAVFAQGIAVTFGPTPVQDAIDIIESHVERSGLSQLAIAPLAGIARLRILQGQFEEARKLLEQTRRGFEELGNRQMLAVNHQPEAEIELLLGDVDAAEQHARRAYDDMTATGDRSFASTMAVTLARALLAKGDGDEAERFARIAVETSASDDVISQAGGRSVQALVLSERGEHDRAILLASEAEAILAKSDYLVEHGEVSEDLATVLERAGKGKEALEAARSALALYRTKGATVFAERAEGLIAGWEPEGG